MNRLIAPAATINYAKTPSKRRRWWLIAGGLAILVAIEMSIAPLIDLSYVIYQHVNRLRAQKVAMTDVAPKVIVYAPWIPPPGWRPGLTFAAGTVVIQPPKAPSPPPTFTAFRQFRWDGISGIPEQRGPLIYARAIKPPHGKELLVYVIGLETDPAQPPQLIPILIQPATLFSRASVSNLKAEPFAFDTPLADSEKAGLKVYAGQPDFTDPSRFTIEYEINGQRHVLDAYIDDHDVLKIEKRKEPTTLPWQLQGTAQ